MSNATDQVTVYKFKMGVGPYRHTAFWAPPSRAMLEANPEAYNREMATAPKACKWFCDHCGTPITNHHIITDSTGDDFCVGSSCIEKLHDSKLSTVAKEAVNKRNRERAQVKRDAKREAERTAREAELQAQKDRNGGLTDYEVEIEKQKAQDKLVQNKRADILVEFTDVLVDGFGKDVCDSLIRGSWPNNRACQIVCEILAKQHGRKNSTAYNEAYPRYAVKLDNALEKLEYLL